MKFANIKVGDVVFTQFVVSNGCRYKKDGCKIGEPYKYAYYKGDAIQFHHNAASDETDKMNTFIKKLNTETQIRNLLNSLDRPVNSKLSINDLIEVYKLLNKVKNKFETK